MTHDPRQRPSIAARLQSSQKRVAECEYSTKGRTPRSLTATRAWPQEPATPA